MSLGEQGRAQSTGRNTVDEQRPTAAQLLDIGRSREAIIGAMLGTESNIISICPLMMSLRAPELPLYGTCSMSVPVRVLKSSPAM